MKLPPARRALARSTLALSTLLLAAAAPEIWARRVEASWSIRLCPEEPGRKYALVPLPGMINAEGFRERELPHQKPPGETRVAVVGDSMTFGGGIPEDQISTRVAERILRERGRELRVLNFAVHGYDVEQVAATLRGRAWGYEPDLVVYAAYVNDGFPTRLLAMDTSGTPVYMGTEPVPGLGGLGDWLQAHSALFRRARGAVVARELAETGGFDQNFDDSFFDRGALAMQKDAAAHGVPLLVWGLAPQVLATADPATCWPEGGSLDFCSIHENLHLHLRKRVEHLGLPYFSGLDALRAGGKAAYPMSPADPHHPNAEGHAVLGAQLADAIEAWLDGEIEGFYSGRSRWALRQIQRGRSP